MNYQPAILSLSLGRPGIHDFEYKMEKAAQAGFKGVELFFDDLQAVSRKIAGLIDDSKPTLDQLLAGADRCRDKCANLGITILTLQPYLFYDGLLDRTEQQRPQVSANFLPASSLIEDTEAHRNALVADLGALADLGAAQAPPVRFAYEALCFSPKINTWQAAWDVVKRAKRPNLGLAIDTFNLVGRIWGDPASADDGRQVPNADAELARSLRELVAKVDLAKVYYLQIADGQRMETPLVKGHEFHVDEARGGYLSVEDVVRAVVEELGYKGSMSLELFSRTVAEPGD
ncbi:xylose isomerase-like protein [Aspergillus pseudotamarii]|uniref:Xylose isomerase-like protein n=1 Tax=Aspergillus pseudotamarii TaxID=132259 RepID=A0A5N6TBD0_ASPPS|nr:xylose isomerase-like protein [Aspergillus pseudotamarii]KAE8143606.1 xylose isomerase-like protein [Aspergillus pseudotamarii]